MGHDDSGNGRAPGNGLDADEREYCNYAIRLLTRGRIDDVDVLLSTLGYADCDSMASHYKCDTLVECFTLPDYIMWVEHDVLAPGRDGNGRRGAVGKRDADLRRHLGIAAQHSRGRRQQQRDRQRRAEEVRTSPAQCLSRCPWPRNLTNHRSNSVANKKRTSEN